jgi:serine/threonine protein kinase
MTPTGRLSPQTVLENRYEVLEMLAKGETTTVYRGKHLGLDAPILIKQLSELYPDPRQAEQQKEQFQSEARLLARLRHPNLVIIYDTFVSDSLPILVLEMVEGKNLEQIAQLAPKPISQKRVLTWAKDLLETLSFLHTQNPPIIVRGLHPRHIVLDVRRQLRLIDFGLAKSMDEKGAGTHNIVKGLGEDGFASLEQGAYSKTDARSDLYSLGAILYFLLTKQVPPSAPRRIVAPDDPLEDPRAINPTVTEDMWKAIQSVMAFRPNDRPNSALEAMELFPFSSLTNGQKELRRCVDCRQPLGRKVLDDIEVDHCVGCGGLWLQEGELAQIRETAELAERSRTEEFVRTVALDPHHPALQALQDDQAGGRQFWSTLTKLLRRDSK